MLTPRIFPNILFFLVFFFCFFGHFQATGTPMAKVLRLHLSAQCALREIIILHNFAIEKVEKNISLQRFRDLKTLFQNCFKIISKEQSIRC
jgi:hypothetical protein